MIKQYQELLLTNQFYKIYTMSHVPSCNQMELQKLSITITDKKHTLAILEFACPSASYQKQPSLTTINK